MLWETKFENCVDLTQPTLSPQLRCIPAPLTLQIFIPRALFDKFFPQYADRPTVSTVANTDRPVQWRGK